MAINFPILPSPIKAMIGSAGNDMRSTIRRKEKKMKKSGGDGWWKEGKEGKC
jgi:hypothetical protein